MARDQRHHRRMDNLRHHPLVQRSALQHSASTQPMPPTTNKARPCRVVLARSKYTSTLLRAACRRSLRIPNALNNGIATGHPLRYPYPGEGGSRNDFRGDGYFEQDASISKVWNTFHNQTLRFAWEVFNVSNSSRFDTSPVSSLGGLNTSGYRRRRLRYL